MAENGILDYQGMNQAIYRGATSNIVVDTQSMSIEIGAGNSSHTSNLHIECDHDANVASIQLNSNVVTEFSRSKKLIKYPRVALTSAAQTGSGYQGHFVTRSTQFFAYNAWAAFDNDNPLDASVAASAGWASQGPSSQTDTYSSSTGAATSQAATHPDNLTQGEWIQIQLPDSIYLHDIKIHSRAETTYVDNMTGFPKNVYLYGKNSNDWILIKEFTTSSSTLGDAYTEYIDYTKEAFTHFVLIVNSIHVSGTTSNQPGWTSIGQIELFGLPEYDPEAHGTDVTVKSYPNVPNTDWLEVYYDAKNYSGLGDVQDETTNNRDAEMNATFDNGEIKAFSFSGADTSNVTTSDHGLGTGDVTYTMSYWFKRTAVAGNYDYVVMLGNGGISYSSALMWINNNQLTLDHWGAALRVLDPIILDTWYHVAAGHSGGNTPSLENDFIYINGKKVTPEIVQTAAPFTLAGSKLTLGTSHLSTTEFFNGSIANFRLFNRALTSDEIYQLYAYQKEYFGLGDLSMTLKAGRLGIGTSEPRAMLDVRGDVHISGSLRKTRALMFRRNSGSYSYTTENTFQTIVDYGPPWVAYSTNPLYNISHTGDYTDTHNHHLYLRIAIKNESTGEVVYFPDSTGWRYYIHTTYQRLDEHSYQGIFSGLIIGNSYTTSYEIKPAGVSSYIWDSTYGDITGIVWD